QFPCRRGRFPLRAGTYPPAQATCALRRRKRGRTRCADSPRGREKRAFARCSGSDRRTDRITTKSEKPRIMLPGNSADSPPPGVCWSFSCAGAGELNRLTQAGRGVARFGRVRLRLSGKRSKLLHELVDRRADVVVTLPQAKVSRIDR